jgi:hypothetical protein
MDGSTAKGTDAPSEAPGAGPGDSAGDDGTQSVDSSRGGTSPEGSTGGPPPDGAPDTSVETISVPGAGTPVSFKTSLPQGSLYLLKAAGSVGVGGQEVDAEYVAAPDGSGSMDSMGTTDVGIDVGRLQPHPMNHTTMVPDGPGRMKWYGGFRSDHTYYMWLTGAGMPLTLKLVTGAGAGSGSITVSLFELGSPPPAMWTPNSAATPSLPPPPQIGRDALDTVYVPVATMTATMGKVATTAGAVYLLQASSAAICGGGGLHMGDAEYMDWSAAGTGFNDGEGKADFGIGVDEPTPMGPPAVGSTYTHRKNWWGPFRNDHVYYMIYAGTGKPVTFYYYDSGYGDNSPTQTLPVQIFPVP